MRKAVKSWRNDPHKDKFQICFHFSLMSLTRVGGSQYMAAAWDVTWKGQNAPVFLASDERWPTLWFKECGGNLHFYFSCITPGFVPRVALVQNCMHKCGAKTPGGTPFFLLEDLEIGASVGKTVLGSPGEETAKKGILLILCVKLHKSQVHFRAAHVEDSHNVVWQSLWTWNRQTKTAHHPQKKWWNCDLNLARVISY